MVTAINTRDRSALCYFSISPPVYTNSNNHNNQCLTVDHFSVETPGFTQSPGSLSPAEVPSALPSNPLLAQRDFSPAPIPASPIMSASTINFLQLQTAAAHGMTPSRPRAKPQQNVLHVSSDDDFPLSSSSSSSSSSDDSSRKSSLSSISAPAVARCSRCQRTPSIDLHTGKSNMVQYGLNLHYCSRCAAIVGFNR